MTTRQCPFCGKIVFDTMTQCPFCRDALPTVRKTTCAAPRAAVDPGKQIRLGLLYVLLAALIGYFSGGYSPLPLPISVPPLVASVLSPFLFLSGVGLGLHGFLLQQKSPGHSARSH